MSSCCPVELTPPPGSQGLFGSAWPLAQRYAQLLVDVATQRGLIGPREVDRVWERHVLQGALLASVLPDAQPVVDVGSGAGLPGIPVALARPDLTVVLLDAAVRRVAFLQEVVDLLGISERVRVRRGRIEELPPGERFPVLTARAVAPLDKLLGWCRPRLTGDGSLFVLIGLDSREQAVDRGARLHCLDGGVLTDPVTVAELGPR